MATTLSALFWGIITFSLLVVMHEGGHMLAARSFGVKVHEFFIGLPGPSLSFKRGGTRYGVTAIPLGGYVRIAGMEGDVDDERLKPLLSYITQERSGDITDIATYLDCNPDEAESLLRVLLDWDAIHYDDKLGTWSAVFAAQQAQDPDALFKEARAHTYLALSTTKRIVVLLAGVTVNIITALLVFTIVLASVGTYVDKGYVNPIKGGPAQSAGLKSGDRLVALDNHSVSTFEEVPTYLSKHYQVGDTLTLKVKRGGETLLLPLTLGKNPDNGKPFLGVESKMVKTRMSVWEAARQSGSYVVLTVKALGGFFNPATFKESASQSSSVVGISVMAAQAAKTGIIDYAWLVAAISLSLGIMNVLPIPPLDGGKIAIELFARARRKPVSMKVQAGISFAGFALLFLLVIFLTFNDVRHLMG